MIGRMFGSIDLMVRVLALAILLAFLLPATGEARVHAQNASNIAIFILFLLNGLRIDRAEIVRGAANLRFLAPLMLWIFGAMALIGWVVSASLSGLVPPLVALGFLFLGTLPSTVQSATSYTMLAGGNAALSVIAAALVNIAGVFVTAPLFALIAGSVQAELGNEVIMRIGLILILPFLIGQAVQGWFREWIARRKQQIVWVDRLVIALAVYVAFSGAVEQDIWDRIQPLTWLLVLAGMAMMLLVGHGGAWLASGALGLRRADRIAFLFAGGQKSAAIGVPLGALIFPVEIAGFVLLPLLLYHLFQLVIAAPLASRLAKG
ncbi:MAG: bile acid:sodium symporter [Erythrobacter sp. 34-65-8]|nr:MAG: bile acid:sodium symporter [Erythrobacter sp. 34-65-8]